MKKTIFSLLALAAPLLVMTSCGGGSTVVTTPPPSDPAGVITITPIPAQTYATGLTVALSATANSGATVTFGGVTGPATLSGSTLTITGAGTVGFTASAPAAGNYSAASATGSFTVNPEAGVVTITPIPAQTYASGLTVALSATANSGAAVTFDASGPATVAGSTLDITGAGSVTVTANAPAAANYTAASATESFTVNPATTPILNWMATPGSTDVVDENILPQVVLDNSGNVFLFAGVSAISSWKFTNAGTQVSSFTSSDAMALGGVATDGSNFFLTGILNGTPNIISLDNNLSKLYEVAPCPSITDRGWFSQAAWSSSLGLVFGVNTASGNPFLTSANPQTGQTACTGGITTQTWGGAEIDSVSLSSTGNVTASGMSPDADGPGGCWAPNEIGYIGQWVLANGKQNWAGGVDMLTQFAPAVLTSVKTVGTSDGGSYATGGVNICTSNNSLLWIARYDSAGNQLWSRTWDAGDPANFEDAVGVFGLPTPLLLPNGGVAVVGSATQLGGTSTVCDMIFIAYDANGNRLTAQHVGINGVSNVLVDSAVVSADGTTFTVGAVVKTTGQALIAQFAMPALPPASGN